ncbi:MAG TPA: hypothetical protein VM943_05120 [Pyrinomonadaceae bacterium]|nr:hypothetical protein [Pyrinomonadaceae bacterium]
MRPANPSATRPAAEMETADSAVPPAYVGGGGDVIITPKHGCAPDSYVVQPCSFEDWTYTFPQD